MDHYNALGLIVLVLLAGCESMTPYVAAEHKSDPSIANDGMDLACAGAKYRERLTVKAGYCWNVRGGGLAEVRVEYDLMRRE